MRRILLVLLFAAAAARAETPETVIATYYPKAGKQDEMVRILKNYWSVLTRLGLVSGAHQLYRAETEGGTVYFVEIFTWRDENIPDNAPADVKTVWAAMRANTDKLDFAIIRPISVSVERSKGSPTEPRSNTPHAVNVAHLIAAALEIPRSTRDQLQR